MRAGAGTPEELETLLEDAFVLRDLTALSTLFEEGAVLVTGGRPEFARPAATMWSVVETYVSEPRSIVQAGPIALLLGPRTASVLRRDADRSWRYAITVLGAGFGPH